MEVDDIEGIGFLSSWVENSDAYNYWLKILLNVVDDIYWEFKYIDLIDVRNIEVNVVTGAIVKATFVFEQGNSEYNDTLGQIGYPDVAHTIIYPWSMIGV